MIKVIQVFLIVSINSKLLWKDFAPQRFLGEWYQIAHGEDHPFVEKKAQNVKMVFRKLKGKNLEVKTRYRFEGESESYRRIAEQDESAEEV